jgi:hypothetical protein
VVSERVPGSRALAGPPDGGPLVVGDCEASKRPPNEYLRFLLWRFHQSDRQEAFMRDWEAARKADPIRTPDQPYVFLRTYKPRPPERHDLG